MSDTCYFLKKNKNSAVIKSFNGHKFYRITEHAKIQAIKAYLRFREYEYYHRCIQFWKTLKGYKDIKIRVASKC
jgi:hypothetical protein